jgi:simple sugar transport system permease protein
MSNSTPEKKSKNPIGIFLEEFTRTRTGNSAWLVPVLAVFTGLLIGAIFIVLTTEQVYAAFGQSFGAGLTEIWNTVATTYGALFVGSFGDPSKLIAALGSGDGAQIARAFNPLADSLVATTPYIFAGLAVALGFRAGLFNIGAEGQFLVGATCAAFVGYAFSGVNTAMEIGEGSIWNFTLPKLPLLIHLPLTLLAGFAGGGLWGMIPGWLKAKTGGHEVINTIMMNYIAVRLVDWLLRFPLRDANSTNPLTPLMMVSARLPKFFPDPVRLHWGFLVALLVAALVWFLLFRTKTGFMLRTVGANPNAARYAGMNIVLATVLAMFLSGGLAGLAGTNELLGLNYRITPGFASGIGFDSIALALLGNNHPLGVVAASLLFGTLRNGATQMQVVAGIPVDIISVLQALILAFIAAPAIIRTLYRLKEDKAAVATVSNISAVSTGSSERSAPNPKRRQMTMGILFLVLAFGIWGLFARGMDGSFITKFGLEPGGRGTLPPLELPSLLTLNVLALIAAILGGVQLARGFGKWTNAVLAGIVGCFVFGFLVWGAADKSLNLGGLLNTALVKSVPIALAALSGVLAERAGVVNIAIEGMMLAGAMAGALVGSLAIQWLGLEKGNFWSLSIGLLAAVIAGALLGLIHGVLSIKYKINQIISGTVINIFSLGLTSYISAKFLQRYQELNNPGTFPQWELPLLSNIPFVGPILFKNNIFVFALFLFLVVIHIGLFYTRWGLRHRAVGEHPKAADTLGINVIRTRYIAVLLSGMMAGFGGGYFTLGSVPRFDEGLTAGRGFIGLAAMIFGNWNPVGSFAASLLFGFTDSLKDKLSLLQLPIPGEFLQMVPYIATMIVLAGLVGRGQMPAADGQPYEKS